MTTTSPIQTAAPAIRPLDAATPEVLAMAQPLEPTDLSAVLVVAQDSIDSLEAEAAAAETDGDLMDPADLPAAVIITSGDQQGDGDPEEGAFIDPMEPSEVTAIVTVDENGAPVEADDPNVAAIVVVTGESDPMTIGTAGDTVTTTVVLPDGNDDAAADLADTLTEQGDTAIVTLPEDGQLADDLPPINDASPIVTFTRSALMLEDGDLKNRGGSELARALKGESRLGALSAEETDEMLRAAADIWIQADASPRQMERSIWDVRRGLSGHPETFQQLFVAVSDRAGQFLETRDPADVNGLQMAATAVQLHAGIAVRHMSNQLSAENKPAVIALALQELTPSRGVNVWQAMDARVFNDLSQVVASKMSDVLSNLAPVATSRVLSTASQGVSIGNGMNMFNEDDDHLPAKFKGEAPDRIPPDV